MKNLTLSLLLLGAGLSHAGINDEKNECTNMWVSSMGTNHLESKPYSGDSHAAYGIFAFKASKFKRYLFKFKGKAPKSRFFSFESYEGPVMGLGHTMFDSDIFDMDLQLPTYMADNLNYEFIVHASEDVKRANKFFPNSKTLELTKSKFLSSIKTVMYRAYAPENQEQLTIEDLPKVYAFDPKTGEPVSCPEVHHFDDFEISQTIVPIIHKVKSEREIEFGGSPAWTRLIGIGTNKAVKDYVLNLSFADSLNDVAVTSFRAPISAEGNDPGQVRYWSFCYSNFAKNETLNCLPDYIAKKDYGKMITIVHARENAQVRLAAEEAGYYFIPDKRVISEDKSVNQEIIGQVYRNLLPTAEFDPQAYEGDYKPKGKFCTVNEFLDKDLRKDHCLY